MDRIRWPRFGYLVGAAIVSAALWWLMVDLLMLIIRFAEA